MPDRPDYPRSWVMSRIRGSNTTPEVRMRAALHRLGVRFRLDQPVRAGAGRPIKTDLTFKKYRLVVFVDGCFWHGCEQHCRIPASNRPYWAAKIGGNVARDQATTLRLAEHGWRVVRIWEHTDPTLAAEQVAEAIRASSAQKSEAAPGQL